jgi:signal transduction histidine kinase
MTRSSISIFLLVVGLLWAVVVSWLFVMLGGVSDLAFIGKALLWYSWMFVGPLLLISGTVLTLIGTHHKAGSVLSLVGCFMLTLMVGYQTVEMLRDLADPLIMRPPYGLYAIAVSSTLMADAGAVHLYRLASVNIPRQGRSSA